MGTIENTDPRGRYFLWWFALANSNRKGSAKRRAARKALQVFFEPASGGGEADILPGLPGEII